MTAVLDAATAQRRFVLLTALRWLPVGFVAPVTVLLAASRGLSPVEVGLAFSAHGLVVVLLELPTGGLADTLGRRPVLLLSSACSLVGLLVLAAAHSVVGFAVAYAVIGVGRALDSGPLESWFVDAAAATGTDPTRGLSRGGVADGLSLALGAVVGGLLPLLFADLLVAPFVAAAALTAVSMAAVAVLVVPVGPAVPHRTARRTARQALREGVADVPRTVVEAVRLARRDRALRLLLVLSAGTGGVLVTLELLAPLHAATLAGGPVEGGRAWSAVLALGFAAAALGSGLAVRVLRLAHGALGRATAVLSVLAGGGLLLIGLSGHLLLLGGGALLFYLLNGASWPLRKALLHSRVAAAQRATMVSVSSLALQAGGLLTNQVAPRLYEGSGAAGAFGAAGGLLVLLALVSLRLPNASGDEEALLDESLDDGQDLLGGFVLGDARAAGQHHQQVPEPAAPVAAGQQRRAVDVDPA